MQEILEIVQICKKNEYGYLKHRQTIYVHKFYHVWKLFIKPWYTLRDAQGGSTFVKDTVDMYDYLGEFEHIYV